MSDTVEKIKERLSILDVVQPYVKLTRAGKHYKGLSPFTKEKTPSFFVSPDRGLYHCFSTGKGGDMFTFLEEMEGVDFRGALKILADKAGVPLMAEAPGARDERERLYAAMEEAKEFFISTFKEKSDARSYLLERGLTEESINAWSIGYAPKGWHELHAILTQKGFTEAELMRAGLVKRAESPESEVPQPEKNTPAPKGRVYDRFRGRIMFPIRDISGRVIAFSGRIFEDEAKTPQAKYLNSPQTTLFDKSRTLYGLHAAREGIRSLGAAILVEGQIDLLSAHQAGYKNVVATSGTAFTSLQAEILKRYTPNLLIAYDGDRAGIAAAGRAAALALGTGLDVKIAKLPPGKDPADMLRENKDLFRETIRGALHTVDFYLAHIADAKYDPRTFRLEVSRTVLPYIAMIGNRIDQAHFIQRVAHVLQVGEDAVRAELKKIQTSDFQVQSSSPARTQSSELTKSEPFLSRGEAIERVVFGLFLLFRENKDTEEAKRAEHALQETMGEERFRALLEKRDDTRAALFEADFFLEKHAAGVREAALLELYTELAKEARHEAYREAVANLRAAEIAHDDVLTEELMRKLSLLASTLH
jgi:DNA primase